MESFNQGKCLTTLAAKETALACNTIKGRQYYYHSVATPTGVKTTYLRQRQDRHPEGRVVLNYKKQSVHLQSTARQNATIRIRKHADPLGADSDDTF